MTHKSCEERVVGLILKISGVRVQRLTHKICEERVDGLILEMDGVRVQRLTHNNNNNNNNISEERADGLTLWLVDGDGSESARWTVFDATKDKNALHVSDENEHEGHDGKSLCANGLCTMAWVKLTWRNRWLSLSVENEMASMAKSLALVGEV